MLDTKTSNHTEPTLASGAALSPISYADALENYRKNTDWWVVFAAFDLPDFQPSPLWVSQRVKLPVDVVVEAMEGLAVLGYLRKENGAFYSIKGKDFVKFNVTSQKKSEVIEEHSLISHQIINQLTEDALMAVDHRCFASSVEILKELYSDVAKAFEKAYQASTEAKNKDRIFKMTFTAVDVLQGRNQ